MKNRISNDILVVFIGFATMFIVSFLRRWIVGNYLGAGDLGLFSVFVSIYTILLPIGLIGIYGVVKYVSEFRGSGKSLNSLLTSAFVNVGISSAVLMVLLFLLSPLFASFFNMPELNLGIKLMALLFPFAIINEFVLGFSNGLRRMKAYSGTVVITTIAQFAVLLILLKLGFGVMGAISSFFALSASIPVLLYLLRKTSFAPVKKDLKATMRKLNVFGGKVFTGTIMTNIFYQADILLLGYFLNAALVGYYSVAIVISRIPWLIPDTVQKLTYPILSEFYGSGNKPSSRYVIAKTIKYTFMLLFPVGIAIIVLGRPIITILFDSTFADAATLPLQILMIGSIFFGTMKALGGAFASIERVGVEIKMMALVVASNLLLNLLLIPIYGIIGAAIAMFASSILFAGLELYYFNSLYKIPLSPWLFLKVGAMCLGIIAAYILLGSLNQPLTVLILVALFAAAAFFSGLLTKDDIKILRQLLK